jgi:hypothetical protein
MNITFQCCFCKGDADEPTAITLTLPTGREQTWFCHPECFAKTTGEHIDILEEDDEASKTH